MQSRLDFNRESLTTIGWIATTILFQSLATLLCKQAAVYLNNKESISALVLNPWMMGMYAAFFLQALTWVKSLRRLPLNIAYPCLSLAYGLNLLGAWLLFKESIGIYHWLGISVIITGVAIIGSQEKQ